MKTVKYIYLHVDNNLQCIFNGLVLSVFSSLSAEVFFSHFLNNPIFEQHYCLPKIFQFFICFTVNKSHLLTDDVVNIKSVASM